MAQFHLLNIDHVVREAQRIAHTDGATLFMGKVKRRKDSVKTLTRDKMRELLEENGLEPRPADKRRRQLIEQCVAAGGEVLECKVDFPTSASVNKFFHPST